MTFHDPPSLLFFSQSYMIITLLIHSHKAYVSDFRSHSVLSIVQVLFGFEGEGWIRTLDYEFVPFLTTWAFRMISYVEI